MPRARTLGGSSAINDRRGSRGLHTAVPMLIGGLALAASALLVGAPWIGYVGLCLSILAVLASAPAFFALPSTFLTGIAAATGFAFIKSAGNTAGFLGPYPGRLGDRYAGRGQVGIGDHRTGAGRWRGARRRHATDRTAQPGRGGGDRAVRAPLILTY